MLRPLSVLYLIKAAKLQPETIRLLVGAWKQLEEQHRAPRPARQWRLEAKAGERAVRTLIKCAESWLTSGEFDGVEPQLQSALREVTWLGRLAAGLLKLRRNGPMERYRRSGVRLRFATRVAQLQPKLGLNLRARHVAALAVVAGVEPPTEQAEAAERRRLLAWERTWKAGKRLAAQLQSEQERDFGGRERS